jgi:signal transduction histidine kinase
VTLQDISISRGTWRGRAVLIATARDVAEQRRLAKELEEQRMLLDAMIRNVPLDVWACDTEGLVILQSARSIERRGDRHGRALVSRSGDRTLRAEWRDQLARALAGEVVVTDVERVVEGETRHLHEVVAPARVAGEVRGVMGVSVDLTEFRRLQHMALDTRRFESLVRMAGGVAHDFNNLLTVILGYAELILAELAPSSPLRDPLEQIRTAGERAARLAHQMLIYSGRAPVRTRPIDVSKVIAEMSHLHEGAVGPRARLLLELAPDLPRIDADESQIRQVVENLVTNAAEAIGDAAGTITITTEVKEVEQAWLDQRLSHRQATAGRFVCVSVTDTGCGIAEDALPQLFDPFYSTKFTGRGLGLPVVRGIAVAQRGVVWATSLPGQGARFEVLFPVLTETAAPPESPAPAVAWRGAGTILVVDDEPGVRDLACRLVADLGFATLSAANGAEALDLFGQRGHEIVGVLLDYAMPGLDGAAVCRELRAAGCRAPILLSSGYSENGLDDALDGLDLAGFLHKPYTPGQVGAALHQALAG